MPIREYVCHNDCEINRLQKLRYYCEALPSAELHIHRGNKEGPIVADVKPCLLTPSTTDVNFCDPLYTLELEHFHHEQIPSMTRFTVDGKSYYWSGHVELVNVKTGDLAAQFYPSWHVIDVQEHKLGKLVIKEDAKDMMDIIVTTALVVQERSDEARQAVISFHFCAF
jgi:hypothetical protein